MRPKLTTLALLFPALGLLTAADAMAPAGAAPPGAAAPQLVTICGAEEPGERLKFWGRVLDYRGQALPKAAVVAYHTDRTGSYNAPSAGTRVPRLRGVAVTDSDGRFGFQTIRPAAYPGASEPAHIHMVVAAPAHNVRHLECWFSDDPLVTPARRERAAGNPSTVIVEPARDAGGAWTFHHDIRLEAN